MDSVQKPKARRKLLSVAGGALGRLLVVLFFLASLVLGAVLHLNLPVSRRAAAQILMSLVSDSLRGTIRVSSFAHFSQRGIAAEEIEVLDPEGRLVLKISHLSAEVDVLSILNRVFSENEKLSIEIERVQAEDCEVLLLPTTARSEDGSLESYPSIADAFEPVPTEGRQRKGNARPVRVWFPHINLRNVYARGSVAGSPTLEVRVADARAQVLATDKGASVDIQRFSMKASGVAGVDTAAQGEIHIRAPGPVWGDVTGTVGDVPVSQKFRFNEGSLTVEGQFPSLEPAAVRPLFSEWPLSRPIAIKNRVDGTLNQLSIAAEIYTESSREGYPPASVIGTLRMNPQLDADLRLVTEGLNLQDLWEDSIETRLDSDSHIEIDSTDEGLQVEFETRVEEGLIEGETTPIVLATGKFSAGQLVAEGTVEEKGLAAHVRFEHSAETGSQLAVDLNNLTLHENKRAVAVARGARGSVKGNVRATLKEDSYTLQTSLDVARLQYDELSLGEGKISTQISGDLQDLRSSAGTVDLQLQTLKFGNFKLSQATLSTEGVLLRPAMRITALTEAGLTLEAETRASLPEREFSAISASISGRDQPILATADRVSVGDSRVTVRNLLVKSTGEIRGDMDLGAEGGRIDLEAAGLSVSRIAGSLGLPPNELGGTLNANVHLTIGARSAGTIDVEVKDGALSGIDRIQLDAHATVDGNATRGNINGSIADLGEIESTWQVNLAGSPLSTESYRRATGKLNAHLRKLDLKALSLLAPQSWGLPDVSGSLTASTNLARSSASSFPEGEISFSTKKLTVIVPRDEEKLRVSGIELDGGISLRPDAEQVEAVLRFEDNVGTLASVSGTLDVPLARWGGNLPAAASEARDALFQSPLNAVLVIPRRNFRRLPDFIPRPLDTGSLGVRASATGTLESPEVSFVLDARKLDGIGSPFSHPVDVTINARYVASSDSLRGNANLISEGARTTALQFDLILPISHLTAPPGGKVPLWTGTGQVQLDNTPLHLFKELESRKMQGIAQGVISLSRPGWSTEVGAEVRLRGLEFGGHRLGDATLQAHTYESDFVARAQFTDEYGTLQTTFEAGVEATSEFLELDGERPMLATLQAERYDAAVALPFVSNLLDELSGSVTGKLRAEWAPPTKSSGAWTTSLSGTMKLSDGVVTPSALGVRLEDTRLQVVATSERGHNVVRVNNIAARADSKTHNLNGNAILYFKNFDLEGGTFHFSPENLPLRSDDSELARFTGTAQGRFDMTGKQTKVELTINNMLATLPSKSDSNLFRLEENSSIEILQHATNSPAEQTQQPSSVTLLRFNLGNNVRVRSDMIDLKLRGAPEMRIAEELQMSGALELIPGGRIDVLGRGFNVESGAVLFDTGDASDPHLNASAAWRAPNGVLVRATVTGTAKAPKIEWSSEPALPGGEAEVIALVLGGGGGSHDQSRAGISSALALGASEALGQTGVVSGVEFYTTQEAGSGEGRVASLNDSSWDSYTAAFRISEELWFEGSYQQGHSTALRAEAKSGVSGTLDWRFHPNWSARTEIGMLGAGLDLVWRYRY